MNYYSITGTNGSCANFGVHKRNQAVTNSVTAVQDVNSGNLNNKQNSSKALPAVTAGMALASLGVAVYSVVRAPKGLKNVEQKVKGISTELLETKRTQNEVNESVGLISGAVSTLREHSLKIEKDLSGKINGLKGEVDGVREHSTRSEFNMSRKIDDVRNDVNGIRSSVSAIHSQNTGFLSRRVNVNGLDMNLATVMHGYGVEEGKLTDTLRAESTKRILGTAKPVELPENAMIRIPTAEFQGFAKTGGLAIVPKELAANLGAVINNKQKAELIVDTPMYLGQVENTNFFSIVKRTDGKYDYINNKNGKESSMAKLNKIDEMKVPIYTDRGKNIENVEVYISDEMYAPVDFENTLAQFDSEASKSIKDALDKGENYETPLVRFISGKSKGEAHKADVKYKTVFYKNDKFRMDGPVQDGKIKNIYNDQTTQAGETERNIYFCKYMYENLVSNHETADKKLKADWIIGNDWHTGALSAMTRLLTPCRKAMGMEPASADKLQNTPITTLMHNFKLQGSAWHSQPKLLNVMFGEHTAKVAENAYMPQKAEMPGHLLNGLFSGKDINPQTMAMAYSDDIVFVSKGNFNEAANNPAMGGTNYALAALRGRTGQYSDKNKLEGIAMASGIRPDEISKFPTAKGITNGCDRVNNLFSAKKVRQLEKDLSLKENSLLSVEDIKGEVTPYVFHQHNKKVYLDKVADDVNTARLSGGADNPLKIRDFAHTDLTGVNEDTVVFGMAGRIVDQKGIDIWSEGILKHYQSGNFNKENPPVFYLQGIGDESYIGKFMEVKSKVRDINPKAADRMVFAGVFTEAGRYDGCKMMSDFSCMPSWDEPCGLVHKEIGYSSGAISIVNKRGGLTDGLSEYKHGSQDKGANSIFVDFMDKETHSYKEALNYNAEKTAEAFSKAEEWHKNKEEFAEGIKSSFTARFDWLKGSVQEYAEIGKRRGVLSKNISSVKAEKNA